MKKLISALIMTVMLTSIFSSVNAYATEKITQKDLIYFVFTDRFYDGDNKNNYGVRTDMGTAYHGGDFQGIIDKLDYIKELGFTAIWISPVVKNDEAGYHGYWTNDFYKTNENFGTMDKLKELVNKAHDKDLKVIFDLVINHTGYRHSWVNDPKYKNWFHDSIGISDFNNQTELENGWLYGLPDLNTENPEVKKYLIDMAKWWIKETGIDGYRLDTVRHVPKEFWTEFSAEIKKDYPDFFLLGEVFNDNIEYVAGYQDTGIDGLVDFAAYSKINAVFKNDRTAEALSKLIDEAAKYKNRNLMGTFIDNHDVERFANGLYNMPNQRVMSALTFMMTYTGIPVLYYGDEIALEGGADPENRRDMDFASKSPVKEYLKKLTKIRKDNPALTDGSIEVLDATPNTLCYARQYQGNTVIVAFNTSTDQQTIEVKLPKKYSASSMKELLTSKDVKLVNGTLKLKLAPMQAGILQIPSSTKLLFYAFVAVDVLIILAVIVVVRIRKRK